MRMAILFGALTGAVAAPRPAGVAPGTGERRGLAAAPRCGFLPGRTP
jgi:hypothetical protein